MHGTKQSTSITDFHCLFSSSHQRVKIVDFGAFPRGPLARRGWFSCHSCRRASARHVGWPSSAVMDKGEGSLIGVIGDEDTVTGFLLAGVGNVDVRRNTNFLVVDGKTTKKAIEDAFKDFTTREDIAVVLINQTVADQIRYLVDEHTAPVPAVLEVPSKDAPYDATKDSILSRVQHLLGVSE